MANDYEKYTYRVIWSKEDQEFVGLCDQFPSLSYILHIRYSNCIHQNEKN